MAFVDRLIVQLNFDGNPLEVGELVLENKQIFFKYYDFFIESGLQISPFKLPLTNQIQTSKEIFFDGLFGVFNDSLPDGWGKLLLDRFLTKNGIAIEQISALDRLSFIGKNGLGALQYIPQNLNAEESKDKIQLDSIAKNMQLILNGKSSHIIEKLYSLGGSSGGARPKIMVGYNKKEDIITSGNSLLDKNFEHWIIKFPSSSDLKDSAQIEYGYYLMAKSAGIEISESKLFKSEEGNQFFGTKRFDRQHNQKKHLLSASGLLHDNFRLSNLDYGHIMDAAFRLENHIKAYEKVFRLACFNVFTHNRDDHSKNFGFLMDKKGKWQFSPAFDLTFSSSSHGYHSTTTNGEGKNPSEKDLLALAEIFDVKNAKIILEEVKETVSNWNYFATEAGVSASSKKRIQKVINNLV